jgi:carbonic anhydrase/acetyltransferase-like protein (isoleucine patch superfamily)
MILGAPGRVVKQLNDQQRAVLKFSADGYVRNFQRHRSEMKQIG